MAFLKFPKVYYFEISAIYMEMKENMFLHPFSKEKIAFEILAPEGTRQ